MDFGGEKHIFKAKIAAIVVLWRKFLTQNRGLFTPKDTIL